MGADEAEQLFERYFPGIRMNAPGETPFEVQLDVFAGDNDLVLSEHTIQGPMTVQVDVTAGFTIALSEVEGELTSGRETIDVSQPWVVPDGQTADTVFTRTRMLTMSDDAVNRVLRTMPGAPASGRFRFVGLSPLSAAHGDLWRSVLATVRPAMVSDAIDSPVLSRSLTDYVTACALACFPHNWEEPPRGSALTPTAAVRRAKVFIDEHASVPITLVDVADAARLSSRHLQGEFRRYYDITPMAYLRRVRLDLARDALLRADPGGDSVARIAHASGFNHLGRFSAAYREAFGEYPRQTLVR
ncbi:AraC-like DNA-binding protein [Microbacterium trichothecenolyticum]|uniref:helix-turn-helix transcriptional regulator n=1 Tax=Microbacterium trichothecenolyticum TaxID=69370 RepID=UPI00285A44B7|nr:helix-turn-helix transcriptional regulator [Microbacterium trichothecenolyticum]MDR7185497.1 AraC-like DNA-binding protein [Microbacterium trichothecenolyticum]